MKIRNGFVSNSSSSSFLIAFKPQSRYQDEPDFEDLFTSEGIDGDNLFYDVLDEILNKVWWDASEVAEDEIEIFEGEPVNVKALRERGWQVRCARVTSYENNSLHTTYIKFKSNNLIIYHQGGH